MISKFFVKGTTFDWIPPPQVAPPALQQDGTLVASALAVPPAMTFAGLDATMPYGKGIGPLRALWAEMNPPASLGLTPAANVPYQWVNYVHGRTAYVQAAGGDILTGFMSGCWIVTWMQGGARHVGHIGTVSTAARNAHPNSTVKQTFRGRFTGAMPLASGLSGFNPAASWELNEILDACRAMDPVNYGPFAMQAKIVALVTRNNHFYSILLIGRPGNVWVCGGKKQVTGASQSAVLAALA